MTQDDFGNIDAATKSGTALATDLNGFRDTVYAHHAGNARPPYAPKGLLWYDNTSADFLMNLFDGANDVPLLQIDTANHVLRQNYDADGDSYIVADTDDQHRVVHSGAQSFRLSPTGLMIGDGSPTVALDASAKTDAIRLPAGSELDRPAPVSGAYIRFNTDTGNVEVWTASTGWFAVTRTLPPGMIMSFGGAVAPAGMLPAMGADLSRAAYPELFAAWGTTWGVGDDATTFGTPDGRNVYVEGAGSVAVGTYLAQSIQAHEHGVDAPETRFFTNIEPNHTHRNFDQSGPPGGNGAGSRWVAVTISTNVTGIVNTDPGGVHNHFVDVNLPAFLSDSFGGATTRPASLTALTCFTY